jgi:hypothetical protein
LRLYFMLRTMDSYHRRSSNSIDFLTIWIAGVVGVYIWSIMQKFPLARLALVLSLFACVGCGEKPIQRASAQGTVTWEGKPIEDGTIVFIPEKGVRGEAVGIPIVDGKYSSKVESGPCIGANKIEIYAKRKTGKTVMSAVPQAAAPIELKEEYIPPQYNQQSAKKFEVKAGTNQFDYDLPPK